MALSRKFLTSGAIGVAAFALISAGASATFTDATHSNQSVQAGTIDVRLTSPVATAGNDTKNLFLPLVGPTNSTFKSTPDLITMINHGTVRADAIWLGIHSDATSAADLALQSQLSVCVYSDGAPIFNGLVSTLQAMGGGEGQQIAGPFMPGVPDTYSAEFYAGTNTTLCGNDTYGGTYATPPSLTDAAQGGLVGTSITVKYVG